MRERKRERGKEGKRERGKEGKRERESRYFFKASS